MGTTLVLVFLGVFALAIVQAVVRRKLNPYAEVAYAGLPDEMRAEIDRVLPGFEHGTARATKKGDEARVDGSYLGEPVFVEADFDGSGQLVDFEVDGRRSTRARGLADPADLPEAALREIDRVLGEDRGRFERSRITTGTSGDERHFEVKGTAGIWKWEIAVSEAGRLLEVEKERRRGRT